MGVHDLPGTAVPRGSSEETQLQPVAATSACAQPSARGVSRAVRALGCVDTRQLVTGDWTTGNGI